MRAHQEAYPKGEHSDHQEVVPKENCGPSMEGAPGLWLLYQRSMSTAKGGLSIVVRSHGPVPSSSTWQRGSILNASCRDIFWACIARWRAPAITDPRALSQGSVWFSKGSRSLRTVSPSFQSSALCGTGDAGGGGVACAGYLNGHCLGPSIGLSGSPASHRRVYSGEATSHP